MAMKCTDKEIRDSHLLLVVDERGAYKWSSCRTDQEVLNMLAAVALDLQQRMDEERLAGIESGYGQ